MKIRDTKLKNDKTKYNSRFTCAVRRKVKITGQDERTSDLPRTQIGELTRRPAPTNYLDSCLVCNNICLGQGRNPQAWLL